MSQILTLGMLKREFPSLQRDFGEEKRVATRLGRNPAEYYFSYFYPSGEWKLGIWTSIFKGTDTARPSGKDQIRVILLRKGITGWRPAKGMSKALKVPRYSDPQRTLRGLRKALRQLDSHRRELMGEEA